MTKHLWLLLSSVLFFNASFSQLVAPRSSSAIMHELKKLKTVGSVLYVAAHPDDENTRLIAWLANEKMLRTGYLSLTRGDGGQNLIGDEQGVELGLIRTQELLAARRIDGGEQFFSTAKDFGYSKTPQETLNIWNKEKLLDDVVWVIRNFKPDIIIARFPEDGRAGHGHHSVSGIMTRLGYETSGDASNYPDQLKKGVSVWQPTRALWNTFNFGNNNTIREGQFGVEVGDYMPLLGQSMGELAGESRSQHKSQGFGVSRQRGSSSEFFETIAGTAPVNDLMDDVNTTWSRFEGGGQIDEAIAAIINAFNYADPSKSVPALLKLRRQIRLTNFDMVWKSYKLRQLERIILDCAGIYLEATVAEQFVVANERVPVRVFAISRSDLPVNVNGIKDAATTIPFDTKLLPNKAWNQEITTIFNQGVLATQPYWLRNSPEGAMYAVPDQHMVGKGENDPLQLTVMLRLFDETIEVATPIRYRYVDPVKAEQYEPLYITEKFLVSNGTGLLLFRNNRNDSLDVTVNVSSYTNAAIANGKLVVESKKTGYERVFDLPKDSAQKGMAKVYRVTVPNYLRQTQMEEDQLSIVFRPGGNFGDSGFYNAKRTISYDHIPSQTHHYLDQLSVLNIDLKTTSKRIAYLPGAGDKTAEALTAMGYTVTLIGKEDLTASRLRQFDAVVTGVRAYNIHDYLGEAYPVLMNYIAEGGKLLVQYNTSNFISGLKGRIAPFEFGITRTRITDENAPVKFLLPAHPVLNKPNKISMKDFEDWTQERSIYHAGNFDNAKFQAPLAFNDPGEGDEAGSLVIAPHGKGYFIYTGIAFFRQLPAAVPGAYRLFANLIEL